MKDGNIKRTPDNAADYNLGSTLKSKSGKRCPVDDYQLDMDWDTGILVCAWCLRKYDKNLTELPKKERD